jgi:hypothetical protein
MAVCGVGDRTPADALPGSRRAGTLLALACPHTSEAIAALIMCRKSLLGPSDWGGVSIHLCFSSIKKFYAMTEVIDR